MYKYIKNNELKKSLNLFKRSITITKNQLVKEFLVDLDDSCIRSEIFYPIRNLYHPPIDFINKNNPSDALFLKKKKINNWNELNNQEWSKILQNSTKCFRDNIANYIVNDDQNEFMLNENNAQRDLLQSQLLEFIPNEMKDIVKYVFQSEGKLTRQNYLSALVGLLKFAIGVNHSQPIGSDHRMLIHSIQLIHSASLLHDDILDNSEIRRGKKAPYKIFGNKRTILLGDYLFSKSCLNISIIENINAMKCISIIAENLVKGEFSQLNGLGSLIEGLNNSKDKKGLVGNYFEKYLLKSYYKTASLFSFGGIACSELLKKAYGNKLRMEMIIYSYYMGLNFGLAFQLMDDILDFTNSISQVNSGKPFFNDIKQGILTIPIYFLLFRDQERATKILVNTNFYNSDKAEILKDLVNILFDTNSIQASIVCVAQYLERYIHFINLISKSERNVFSSFLVKMADKLLKIIDDI